MVLYPLSYEPANNIVENEEVIVGPSYSALNMQEVYEQSLNQ